MAIEKWELPRTISELRAFLGFTNYYSMYVEMYAEVVAILQDKLKVPRELGKKGSRHKLQFNEEDIQAFEEIKKRLCSKLILQRVNPDKPFILRVDASRYAVGATLEQKIGEDRNPTDQDVIDKKNCTGSVYVKEISKGTKELDTKGTGNIRHSPGSPEMGELDWESTSVGPHRLQGIRILGKRGFEYTKWTLREEVKVASNIYPV